MKQEMRDRQRDLFETKNRETAAGLTAYARRAPQQFGPSAELGIEPGVYLRFGHTQQSKNLLEPEDLSVWDRRLSAALGTLDAPAHVEAASAALDRGAAIGLVATGS